MSAAATPPSTWANLALAAALMVGFILLANGRHMARQARKRWQRRRYRKAQAVMMRQYLDAHVRPNGDGPGRAA